MAGSTLMSAVLLLRRIQSDIEGLLSIVYVEGLPERLIALGDDLYENLPLWDFRDARLAFLIAAHFPFGSDLPAELHHRAAFLEFDDHAGVFHGFAGLILHHDGDFGHV